MVGMERSIRGLAMGVNEFAGYFAVALAGMKRRCDRPRNRPEGPDRGGHGSTAAGIAAIALSAGFAGFTAGAVLLGIGTAMVYPTLLAAIGDVVHPSARASAVGVYRFWRDMGYAAGALLSGAVADLFGVASAVRLVAALTFVSGAIAAAQLRETWRRVS